MSDGHWIQTTLVAALIIVGSACGGCQSGPLFGEKAEQVLVTSNRLLAYGAGQIHDKNKRVVAHDLLTGRTIGEDPEWFRRGCTTPRASSHLLTTRYKGNAAHIDLATGRITSVWNVRAACSNNLFPADGVLSRPGLAGGCTCKYMPISQGFVPSSAFE